MLFLPHSNCQVPKGAEAGFGETVQKEICEIKPEFKERTLQGG
jgi:hypothetical protein